MGKAILIAILMRLEIQSMKSQIQIFKSEISNHALSGCGIIFTR